eukprot:CAMPEP_0178936928 /NCGR_PEP_ID=MMETSP0786-20121207/25459_1 /TAXON_ID=186022 /ORGANISM="Thalassionema frauenfeldii, Strain CCMP 1798" /LENGTH=818 /DNA_ID=CAMNT_0020615413 /DNA_START=102 /DNA_END=2558 /DNA_ORIENTATION=+
MIKDIIGQFVFRRNVNNSRKRKGRDEDEAEEISSAGDVVVGKSLTSNDDDDHEDVGLVQISCEKLILQQSRMNEILIPKMLLDQVQGNLPPMHSVSVPKTESIDCTEPMVSNHEGKQDSGIRILSSSDESDEESVQTPVRKRLKTRHTTLDFQKSDADADTSSRVRAENVISSMLSKGEASKTTSIPKNLSETTKSNQKSSENFVRIEDSKRLTTPLDAKDQRRLSNRENPELDDGKAERNRVEEIVKRNILNHEENGLPESKRTSEEPTGCEDTAEAKKNSRKARIFKQLEYFGTPGILTVCHKPKVFTAQMVLSVPEAERIAHQLFNEIRITLPEYAGEVPADIPVLSEIKAPTRLIDPQRVDKGYFKSHLVPEFVESLGNSLPKCVRVKRSVRKKGIAFMSVTPSLCDTHYDQDTSFLLVLTGKKEVCYAPPSMVDRLRVDHPVLYHSSIFEEVNPFVAATGTLWKFKTLCAGDGMLLPQGWLHAIKSTAGTAAISFQVESSGIHATSPNIRRHRSTGADDMRHVSMITLDDSDEGSKEEVNNLKETKRQRKQVLQPRGSGSNFVPEQKDSIRTVKRRKVRTKSTKGKRKTISFQPDAKSEVPVKLGPTQIELITTKKNTGRSSINATKHPRYKPSLPSLNSQRLGSKESENVTPVSDIRPAAPLSSTSSRKLKHKLKIKLPKGILPTRKVDKRARLPSQLSNGVRRSRREKLCCGVEGCNSTFPVSDGVIWVMMLNLEAKGDKITKKLPVIPTFHPKHLICLNCRETGGAGFFEPHEVLTEEDKKDIEGWDQYTYYTATRADYDAKLRLNDEQL